MGFRRPFASDSRKLALIGVVAVLLAVVAWAATGVRAGGAEPSRTASPIAIDALDALVAAAWGAGVVAVVIMIRRLRNRLEEDMDALDPQRQPRPWWVSLVAWLIVAAVFLIPLLFLTDGQDSGPRSTPTAQPASDGADAAGDRRRPSPWAAAGFVVGAAVAALVLNARRSARIEHEPVPLNELLADVVEVVDDSIGDIERDPDPRRASIRAYARMEAVLARGGVPRRPSETPLEYIDGALRALSVPAAPARSLTDLFEVAKFSDRPIDASMKQRAIDCFLDIRSALTSEVT
jgi:Domain of unknown function (DUF4129)